MIIAVWAPLLLPFLAAPLARRLADALTPRAAAWSLAVSAAALACGTLCSLGLLTAAGLLQLPPVAALGHLPPHWLSAAAPRAALSAALAGPVLAALAALTARTARRHRRELRRTRAALAEHSAPAPTTEHPAATTERPTHAPVRRARARPPYAPRQQLTRARALLRPTEHPLTVLDDERADAFALPGRLPRPGHPGEPGRIVVTSGMLRALDAPERAALLAHERAHLDGRHHLFLALAEHAATVHPALRPLRGPLAYHLERWADEAAAARTGDRAATARAVGRAALAAGRTPRPARPQRAAAAHTGPVPRRVAALLRPVSAAAPRRRAAALALTACLALTAAATLDATADLHHAVEAAQRGPAAP
ncbi:M56 family metallopeptidase [Kitasatospora sp. NPDC052868]|uniref:M56 family metallopeptidase n=1 Tax=Kitasatospora sp. NPDC052868 TaxID=3364060 RepID=UPI0037C4EFDE